MAWLRDKPTSHPTQQFEKLFMHLEKKEVPANHLLLMPKIADLPTHNFSLNASSNLISFLERNA